MTRRNVVALACAAAIMAALFVGIGVSLGQRSMIRSLRIQIDGVQAMLLANRMVKERRIKSLLARGCGNKAIGEIINNESSIIVEEPNLT
jgi:putative effector of murein hydrolase